MAIAAAPYLHAKVLAAPAVEQKEVHHWHLEHIRDNNHGILRGKPVGGEMKAAIDALPPRKPDESGNLDQQPAAVVKGPDQPKKHWAD